MPRPKNSRFAFAVALLAGSPAFTAPDGGRSVGTLPDGGRAARFTDFTPVPPPQPPPNLSSSCIGTARDGGCVFSFAERAEDDLSDLLFPDGGRPLPTPGIRFNEATEPFALKFQGGSCSGASLVVDGGCWVQLHQIRQGDPSSGSYAIYRLGGRPDFVPCDAGLDLCDNVWRCDCTPRPSPAGVAPMPTEGGARTGTIRPRRKN